MKLSEFAKLAASDINNLPEIIRTITESLENTDDRLSKIENAIRELAPKIGNQNNQLAELANTVVSLKQQVKDGREDTVILKTWLNETTMRKVSEIDGTQDMVIVKKKNDGMLPSVRKDIKEQEITTLKTKAGI